MWQYTHTTSHGCREEKWPKRLINRGKGGKVDVGGGDEGEGWRPMGGKMERGIACSVGSLSLFLPPLLTDSFGLVSGLHHHGSGGGGEEKESKKIKI